MMNGMLSVCRKAVLKDEFFYNNRNFKDSGLLEFLKGSWANANKILQLNGIASFPNDNS